jgi:hypothetical protein
MNMSTNRFPTHLTYGNVMSSIALFLAIGGVSWAATALPRNSVGTAQIRTAAITSIKVRDRSLTASDFAAGALRGVPGPAGPQGPTGDAPAPAGPAGPAGTRGAPGAAGPAGLAGPKGIPGPFGPLGQTGQPGTPGTAGTLGARVVSFTEDFLPNRQNAFYVEHCPPGTKVLSGSAGVNPKFALTMDSARPGNDPTAWEFQVSTLDGEPTGGNETHTVPISLVCVPSS